MFTRSEKWIRVTMLIGIIVVLLDVLYWRV